MHRISLDRSVRASGSMIHDISLNRWYRMLHMWVSLPVLVRKQENRDREETGAKRAQVYHTYTYHVQYIRITYWRRAWASMYSTYQPVQTSGRAKDRGKRLLYPGMVSFQKCLPAAGKQFVEWQFGSPHPDYFPSQQFCLPLASICSPS